jgi:hypothetical protein
VVVRAIVLGVPPAILELSFLRSALAAIIPGVPTGPITQVDNTVPVKTEVPVAACANGDAMAHIPKAIDADASLQRMLIFPLLISRR